MTIEIITSPEQEIVTKGNITLFLGGSIELGKAKDWQIELIDYLKDTDLNQKLQIFNPRRRNWDASWPVDNPDHAELKEQIQWELEHQDKADILIYYFAGHTISPITLFELGIYAHRKPIIFIQRAYLRFANVKITADHFGWSYHTDENAFRAAITQRINSIAQV